MPSVVQNYGSVHSVARHCAQLKIDRNINQATSSRLRSVLCACNTFFMANFALFPIFLSLHFVKCDDTNARTSKQREIAI